MKRRWLALLAATAMLVSVLGGTATAAPRGITEKDIFINGGDHRIPATVTMPALTGRNTEVPAVLLLHGFASSRHEVGDLYARLAQDLAEQGYASVRIDFAGSGDSTQPFVENTYDGMLADSRAALDHLVGLRQTDDDRVGVLGFSLGAKMAEELAGTDDRVNALATWSGATANGATNSQGTFDAYYDEALANGSVTVDLGFRVVELGIGWFDSIAASTPLDAVGAYEGPLLAVAGTEDTSVDPVWSRELVRWSGSLDATLRILEGADHIYNVLTPDQTLAEELLSITTEWFTEKL